MRSHRRKFSNSGSVEKINLLRKRRFHVRFLRYIISVFLDLAQTNTKNVIQHSCAFTFHIFGLLVTLAYRLVLQISASYLKSDLTALLI
jgi:hypothetical protein